jgi:cell wall-associated NlpC family hydrolase
VRHAFSFLNSAYLWGGRSAFGIDCSGLTQVAFRMAGINLLRDASQQASQGSLVNFLEESLEGDLAFFDNEEGRITHVGIVLNDHRILHASEINGALNASYMTLDEHLLSIKPFHQNNYPA